MSAKYFIDTNVFVYSFDDASPRKRNTARQLIAAALRNGDGAISWQVVQEFLNVALHKWEVPLPLQNANEYLSGTLEPLCQVYPSTALWQTALSIHSQSQYRFDDSLIVASAIRCKATTLYSEDLQAGRQFGDLEIRNPFA